MHIKRCLHTSHPQHTMFKDEFGQKFKDRRGINVHIKRFLHTCDAQRTQPQPRT